MTRSFLLLLIALSAYRVTGRSTGPPAGEGGVNQQYVCNLLQPNPINHEDPQDGDGGSRLTITPSITLGGNNGFSYTADTTYTIVLSMGGVIDGFLVQARMPGDMPTNLTTQPMALLGSFTAGTNQQILTDCVDMGGTGDQATIGHQNGPLNVMSVSFDWTAPSTDGEVDFLYTVVRERTVHFDALSAAQIAAAPTNAPTTDVPTTDVPTTEAPTTDAPIGGNPTAPTRDPDDYRFIVLSSPGCARVDCDLFIAIDTNEGDSDFLDIYMEGNAEGWIAVGFSDSNDMFSADVVACNRVDPDIMAIDGWNPSGRSSIVDTIQDVTLHASAYTSGRLSCIVSKRIAPNGAQDLDLTQDLFVISAWRSTATPVLSSLSPPHSSTRRLGRMVDVSTVVEMPTAPPTTELVTLPPGNPTAPTRDPEDYRFNIASSPDCTRADCDLFIAIDTNEGDMDFLDIYMEGNAEGWIAVGFSDSNDMFSADVVACNRRDTIIMPIDGWNVPMASGRDSISDVVQDVTLQNSSFTNGRLYCTVSKRIAPNGGQDLNLADELFVIFAWRDSPSAELDRLSSHTSTTRGRIGRRVDASTVRGSAQQSAFDRVHRPRLIRAHGTLMVIAWPLFAIIAIFFAAFMRPALPNGEWFQVHRAFMIASLIITTVAFVLIFVALKDSRGLVDTSSGISVVHLVFGCVILALQIANPIISIFRCKPDSSKRWIFNLIHGSVIGYIAEALAFSNVGIGLSIFTSTGLSFFSGSRAPLWLYIAWTVVHLIIIIALIIVFSVRSSITKEPACAPSFTKGMVKGESIEMKAAGEQDKSEEPGRKQPSKDSPIRWIGMAVYVGITVPVMIAIIVMVGLPASS